VLRFDRPSAGIAAISITRNDVSTFTDRWEIVYTCQH
jgi:hypothetical protein